MTYPKIASYAAFRVGQDRCHSISAIEVLKNVSTAAPWQGGQEQKADRDLHEAAKQKAPGAEPVRQPACGHTRERGSNWPHRNDKPDANLVVDKGAHDIAIAREGRCL